jgi:hypothetical protein
MIKPALHRMAYLAILFGAIEFPQIAVAESRIVEHETARLTLHEIHAEGRSVPDPRCQKRNNQSALEPVNEAIANDATCNFDHAVCCSRVDRWLDICADRTIIYQHFRKHESIPLTHLILSYLQPWSGKMKGVLSKCRALEDSLSQTRSTADNVLR